MHTCYGYLSKKFGSYFFFSDSSRHLNKPVWDLRSRQRKRLFFKKNTITFQWKKGRKKKCISNGLCLTCGVHCALCTSMVKLFLSRTLNIQPDIINPVDPFIHPLYNYYYSIRVEKKKKKEPAPDTGIILTYTAWLF